MDLLKACKQLLIKRPFYGIFLLSLNKYYGTLCDTACVCRNGINTELCVNKEFWDKLTDDEQLAILEHECQHICFKHMTMAKSFGDPRIFNYAADCEINCYIENLPEGGIKAENFNLPPMKGTKFYYPFFEDKLKNQTEDNSSQSNGSGNEIPDITNHDTWKDFQDLSDAEKELIEQQVDTLLKRAAEQCEKMCGRGSIPGNLVDIIDELFKPKPAIFDWKKYFRRLIGTAIDINVKKSRRKESKRFDGAAGLKHKKKHSLLVAIDVSGSVYDAELVEFFSEINHIYKAGANVDVIEFDDGIKAKYAYDGKFPGKVHGRGGTSFHEPVQFYNDHRKEYSSFVLFTDGVASIKGLKPLKEMIWVITSDGWHDQNYPGKVIKIPKKNNK